MIRLIPPVTVLSLILASCGEPAVESSDPKPDPKLQKKAAVTIPQKVEIDGYTIETKDLTAQPAVTTRKTVKMAELSAVFGKELPGTFVYAGKNGGEVAGMPFAIYHKMVDGEVDVEFGCPLKKAIAGDATYKSATLPAGKVAMTTHRGAYQDLTKAHAVMDKWFEAHGATRNGPPWEVYIDDPTKVAPKEVRTLVYYPIK